MSEISIKDVKRILNQLLDNKISKEAASEWALKLRKDSDKNCLTYIPIENEQILWESILFIEGIDLKDSPNSYLHNNEDILIFLKKIEF